jgi:hypothetical protein
MLSFDMTQEKQIDLRIYDEADTQTTGLSLKPASSVFSK